MENALSHLARHRKLLQEEFGYEKAIFSDSITSIPVETRVSRGICRYPLIMERCRYNSLNQYIIITRMPGGENIDHVLESGTAVRFFFQDKEDRSRFLDYQCTVSYSDGNITAVAVPDEAAANVIRSKEKIGIQLAFDETTYSLMFNAIDQVMAARGDRLAELRDILLGAAPAGQRTCSGIDMSWLNQSQKEAVEKIVRAKDLMIVHGPPGTGKTTTLVEAIFETLFRENQVLVCAQSNMAVDWICEKLIERGIQVLRIGNPARINPAVLASTFEKKFEDHPDYPLIWKIRKDIRDLRSSASRKSGKERERIYDRIRDLQSMESETGHRMTSSILDEAPVIACTLAGSASKILDRRMFSTLFIDEAAQALEAASWIAITKAGRVIFAGDHCQLPPTVKSPETLRKGLGTTLMETAAKAQPEAVHMLSIQYRCAPEIMNFSSEVFYNGKLTAADSVISRNTSWAGKPVEWADTAGMGFRERLTPDRTGRINRKEARYTVSVLKGLISSIGAETVSRKHISIGIISPYRAQVFFLKHLVASDPELKPYRDTISVNTIDGFQGQEKDIIIIGMVRSNDDGNIGFLNEVRRMNVALTRARYKLVIVGDSSTLDRNIFYKVLHRYITGAL